MDSSLIMYLIHGFGLEYDYVVTFITSRSYLLSFEEAQSLLMTHESSLECHLTISNLSMKLQANLTFRPNLRPFFPSYIFGFSRSSMRSFANNNISSHGSGSSGSFLLIMQILH